MATLLRSTFNHHLFCLRLSPLLEYLHTIKPLPLRSKKYFLLSKALLYLWLFIFPIRGFYFCYLKTFYTYDSAELVSFDPLFGIFVLKYRFLEHNATLSAGVLLAWFGLYMDYAITCNADQYSITLLYNIIVVNAKDFFALNSNLFKSPIRLLDLLQNSPIKSFKKLRNWAVGLWNCENAKFKVQRLPLYETHPPVIRIRHVLITAVFESLFMIVNMFSCKCLTFDLFTFNL